MKTSIILFILVGFCSCQCNSNDTYLYCGIAKSNITPEKPVLLAGYPNPQNRKSMGIHDSIYCKVVYFEYNNKKVVFVSGDIIGYYGIYDTFYERIKQEFGYTKDEVFLSATHTHSGPFLTYSQSAGFNNNKEYTEFLLERIIKTIESAKSNKQQVSLYVGQGSSMVAANRRVKKSTTQEWPFDGGYIKQRRNTEGVADKSVSVINIKNKNNQAIGCMYNYACHARSLRSRNRLITGDIFSVAADYVEKNRGNEFIAASFAGASGDIDPWYVKNKIDKSETKISETDLMGMMLGAEVLNIDEFQKISLSSIKTSFSTLSLPSKKYYEYTTDNNLPPTSLNITYAVFNDICFIGFGAEVGVEIGLEIKKKSPFRNTFIITHCNGASGYLQPTYMIDERGYEVSVSPFGPGASETVVSNVIETLNSLYRTNRFKLSL